MAQGIAAHWLFMASGAYTHTHTHWCTNSRNQPCCQRAWFNQCNSLAKLKFYEIHKFTDY